MTRFVLFFVGGVFISFLSCSPSSSEATNTEKKELILYCGAGIRPACKELIEGFEAKRDDVTVSATYAGSGRLLGQLAASKRGDLFMTGSSFYVDKAIEDGLAAAETKKRVAYFVPVIFVQKGNPYGIATLRDFVEKDLRIGLGDDRAVAIGKRAVKIFEKNEIPYEKIKEKLTYVSGTVNELGAAIELKNIDLTIVWDANARQFKHAGDIVEIPPKQNVISTIPIARLASSEHPEAAKEFIDFVTSEAGKEILRKQKYTIELPQQE